MREYSELGEEEARAAIEAIRAELLRRKKTAVIAVGDSHGELISLLRMDGSPLPSIEVATRKVWTAARERVETGVLGGNFNKLGRLPADSEPRFTGWDGGIPVMHRGRLVGAVAVSGLDQAEDAEIARIGVAKVAERIGG
jgi:glc operon protein GlcG